MSTDDPPKVQVLLGGQVIGVLSEVHASPRQFNLPVHELNIGAVTTMTIPVTGAYMNEKALAALGLTASPKPSKPNRAARRKRG